jgi:hypothetical protein
MPVDFESFQSVDSSMYWVFDVLKEKIEAK